jgi:hypothetical protein
MKYVRVKGCSLFVRRVSDEEGKVFGNLLFKGILQKQNKQLNLAWTAYCFRAQVNLG